MHPHTVQPLCEWRGERGKYYRPTSAAVDHSRLHHHYSYRCRCRQCNHNGDLASVFHLLEPVVTRFARAFETGFAESAENRDFWNRVVHWQSMGSGPTYLSGWLTAFCVFDEQGKWIGGNMVCELALSASALSFQLSVGH